MHKAIALLGAALLPTSAALAQETVVAQRVVQGEAMLANPVWSVDGRHIAFQEVALSGSRSLKLVELSNMVSSGTPRTVKLPGGSSFDAPADQDIAQHEWHEQGVVVFQGSNEGGIYRIYFAEPGGSSAAGLLPTTKVAGNMESPTIFADSAAVAFVDASSAIRAWFRDTDLVLEFAGDDTAKSNLATNTAGTRLAYESATFDGDSDVWQIALATPDLPASLVARMEAEAELSAIRAAIDANPPKKELKKLEKQAKAIQLPIVPAADRNAKVSVEPTLVAGGAGDQVRPAYIGDHILFLSTGEATDTWELHRAGPDGDSATLATGLTLPSGDLAVSPDAKFVAWTLVGSDALVLGSPDSGPLVELSTGLERLRDPALSIVDDKMFVAFIAYEPGEAHPGLFIADVTPPGG